MRGHLVSFFKADDRHALGAHADRGARHVHRHVAAAEDHEILVFDVGQLVADIGVLQEGHAVGDIGEIVSGDWNNARILVADADEDGVEALLLSVLAMLSTGVLVLISTPRAVMFLMSRSSSDLGHAVGGHAVAQHAAGLRFGLEDGDLVALLGQVERRGQSAGAGANDGHLGVELGFNRAVVRLRMVVVVPVDHEALDGADVDGAFHFAAGAFAFAGA